MRGSLMKIKWVIIAVLLACGGLFFVEGPDGAPLMTLDKLLESLPGSPSEMLPGKDVIPAAPVVTRIYKWKDKDGVWQFSNLAADEEGAEIMEIDNQINIVQAFEPAEAVAVKKKVPKAIPGVMTVSPQEAADLLDTVNNLQETIDQRKADMDAITNMGND